MEDCEPFGEPFVATMVAICDEDGEPIGKEYTWSCESMDAALRLAEALWRKHSQLEVVRE
jgi:hypothetical protein